MSLFSFLLIFLFLLCFSREKFLSLRSPLLDLLWTQICSGSVCDFMRKCVRATLPRARILGRVLRCCGTTSESPSLAVHHVLDKQFWMGHVHPATTHSDCVCSYSATCEACENTTIDERISGPLLLLSVSARVPPRLNSSFDASVSSQTYGWRRLRCGSRPWQRIQWTCNDDRSTNTNHKTLNIT